MISGKKLRLLRINSNLTQDELAQKLNITRQSISQWENDKCLPDICEITELSRIYKVDLDKILL